MNEENKKPPTEETAENDEQHGNGENEEQEINYIVELYKLIGDLYEMHKQYYPAIVDALTKKDKVKEDVKFRY